MELLALKEDKKADIIVIVQNMSTAFKYIEYETQNVDVRYLGVNNNKYLRLV